MKKKLILIMFLVLSMSGCVTQSSNDLIHSVSKSPTGSLGYKTINFQGIELQYRDLSVNRTRQAVPSSFDVQPNDIQTPATNLVSHEPPQQGAKVTFKKNRASSLSSRSQLKTLKQLADYKELTVQYQIQASAGGDSLKAKSLARKRATYIKTALIKQGVPAEKIVQLDYDPNMPGQLGFVWVRPLSVSEQLIYQSVPSKKSNTKKIILKRIEDKARDSDA